MEKGNIMDKKWTVREVRMLSPLQLAYIGDAVYEVLIRNYLLEHEKLSVNNLHKKAIKYVKAEGQSNIIHEMMDELTEEEIAIVKRGRNTKSATVPKNANISDYRYATGFEALIGYLYLLNRRKRIKEIFNKITKE
ncbi:Mini-ribonuclease 3 [Clostridium sp. D2Q-14]|uniref:Mini-ribonuclease 3 n=1 Tax=Anaeromonas gelatinilytica TaxID=2683194 RepID=UPI00193AEB63|nr:ribonuclease III domain-containing protein [Anaeromonas gelatinilytica]MBS4534020.1 Mini-ribonuclease 3 [Anaeromonas gelatinilytica]